MVAVLARRQPRPGHGAALWRLDLDGDLGMEALRAVLSITTVEHSGPVARTGGGGWHVLYRLSGLSNLVGLLPGWTGGAGMGWSWPHPPSMPAAATTAGSGP
jgi:hypothetical protein